jgi:hypothetical protein
MASWDTVKFDPLSLSSYVVPYVAYWVANLWGYPQAYAATASSV